MKRRIAFIITLAAILLLAACSGGGTSPTPTPTPDSTPETPQVLRVGMECDYAPFNWTQLDDSNGAVMLADGTYAGGYDVEIAKLVAATLEMELEIVKTDWDGLPPSLTSSRIDLIIAGMTDTEERRETIDFTDEYYTSDLVIVVRKDDVYADATSIQDFAGAKITGQQNTLHYDVIDQIEGVDKQQAYGDFPTMVIALTAARIDGYVSERPGAISATAANPDLTYIVFDAESGFTYAAGDVTVSIGIRKDDTDLKDAVNSALARISEDDRLNLMESAILNQPMNS